MAGGGCQKGEDAGISRPWKKKRKKEENPEKKKKKKKGKKEEKKREETKRKKKSSECTFNCRPSPCLLAADDDDAFQTDTGFIVSISIFTASSLHHRPPPQLHKPHGREARSRPL